MVVDGNKIKCDANEAELVPLGIAIVLNCFELLITKRSSLDSIRLETHGMTPTLSLIRLMITHKSLRRAIHRLREDRG